MTVSKSEQRKIVINEQLQHLWRELTEDEGKQLELNCLLDAEHQIMPAVVLWENHPKGCDTVVDGHNQYHYRKKNKLAIRTVSLPFSSIEEASAWSWRAQAGRRNSTASQLAIAAAKYQGKKMDAIAMALKAGVSISTLNSAKKIAGSGSGSVVKAVASGDFSVSDAEKILSLPKKEQAKIVKDAKKEGTTLNKQRTRKKYTAAKPKKGGELKSTALKKQAVKAFGVLQRLIDKLGIDKETGPHMDALIEILQNCDQEVAVPF
jgi:hypothetical protein